MSIEAQRHRLSPHYQLKVACSATMVSQGDLSLDFNASDIKIGREISRFKASTVYGIQLCGQIYVMKLVSICWYKLLVLYYNPNLFLSTITTAIRNTPQKAET